MPEDWNGKPGREGWHWLLRLRDKVPVMAYWHPHRLHWWVADEEGRTRPMSDKRPPKATKPPPSQMKVTNGFHHSRSCHRPCPSCSPITV